MPEDSENHGPPTCRICLSAESQEDDDELIQPCQCRGSQAWVHKKCLQTWQSSVQLGLSSNHPRDIQREVRHKTCNVCKQPFNVEPPSRATILASLAGIGSSVLQPGLLLVSSWKEDLTEDRLSLTGGHLSMLLQVVVEAKHKHFQNAVYLLTEHMEHHAVRGNNVEDAVLGLNLVRPVERQPESVESMLGISVADLLEDGVDFTLYYGGPVNTKSVSALCLVPCSLHDRVDQAGASLRQLMEVNSGVQNPHELIVGPLAEVLVLARAVATAANDGVRVPVAGFTGYAVWSRTQLLGEIARGSWLWRTGEVTDVLPLPASACAPGEAADMLRWAPRDRLFERCISPSARVPLRAAAQNEMAREFQERVAHMRPGVDLRPRFWDQTSVEV